jgi:hypothetical protein
MVIFCGNLPQYFNPRNSRVKITTVLFYNIGPWSKCSLFSLSLKFDCK